MALSVVPQGNRAGTWKKAKFASHLPSNGERRAAMMPEEVTSYEQRIACMSKPRDRECGKQMRGFPQHSRTGASAKFTKVTILVTTLFCQ
jgi:hypothetical protein